MSSRPKPLNRGLYAVAQALLLGGALAGAALSSRAADWHPAKLLLVLLGIALVGDRFTLAVRSQNLSPAFIALVLAMVLLGPAPAVAIGVLMCVADAVLRRLPVVSWLTNLTTVAAMLLCGGLLMRALAGDLHSPQWAHRAVSSPLPFGLLLFGVFVFTNLLNFALIAAVQRILRGHSIRGQVRDLLVPLLPGQLVAAALAAVLGAAYTHFGVSVLLFLVAVLALFHYLAVALIRSEDRAEELAAKAVRLATLQVGVLTAMMETLNLRDPRAARHAAAVARYARDLAEYMELPERDQEIAHTAGLMHDIGRFAFPDRVLYAEWLDDADHATVRRHPQDGAAIVGRLDGYGPVAEIVLYHHEHFDGTGYPAGLIAKEIPLLARIVAVCETYDVLTARHSYRAPLTPHDAFAEMRSVSNRQLDGELVEAFIAMLERDGPVTSARGDNADFAAELNFERRARALAAPAAA